MRSGTKARLAVAVAAAAVALPLASCAYQQGMPQNTISCNSVKPGWMALYLDGKLISPGMMHVRGARVCAWAWPSQEYNGQVTTFTNPPIQVTTWAGAHQVYPGDAEWLYSPVPVTLTS